MLDVARLNRRVWEFFKMLFRFKNRSSALFLCFALLITAASTGCQTSIGGQTLPSAYFLGDDIQYFPQGPQFKLSREAAALKAAREDAAVGIRP